MNIREKLKELTLEEKVSLLSAADFWHTKAIDEKGVPAIMLSDGPNGLRKQEERQETLGGINSVVAICFPTAVTMASSFDSELIKEVGEALGEECQAENVQVLLGPGINMKRSPLCGRNFEYYSEDPFLAGKIGTGFVNGVQSKNVGVSLKHFAANNQESRRFLISANMTKRTLHEIYLRAFEAVVKNTKPWTLMCSYNRINGVYSSENKYLLTDVLKKKWGYEGLVMTDWGAMNNKCKSVSAGLALEMPTSNCVRDKYLAEKVAEGAIDEKVVDERVLEVLSLIEKGISGRKKYINDNGKKTPTYDKEKHHELSRKVATESAVLLKNEEKTLPLSTEKTNEYVFFGEFAEVAKYQGGGSSHINCYRIDSVMDALKTGEYGDVSYVKGFYQEPEEDKTGKPSDEELLQEAIKAAENAEVSVVFAGLPDSFESEGFDRRHMQLPENQNIFIKEISKVSKKTVVVLFNGSPVEMPWINEVDSVLEMYLSGEAVGFATLDLLFGKVSPSGHLAETFPLRLEDTPCFVNFPGNDTDVEYGEGVYIGYRYYDKKKLDVLFPFGHGLTYTNFEYSDMEISKVHDTAFDYYVKVNVKNTGDVAAKAVVQAYVYNCSTACDRPEKELKGVHKVFLKPGESAEVEIKLNYDSFAYFDEAKDDFYVPSGEYVVAIGDSSRNLLLEKKIDIDSTDNYPFFANDLTTVGDIMNYALRTGRKEVFKPLMVLLKKSGYDKITGTTLESAEDLEKLNAKKTMNSAMFFETPLHSILSFSKPATDDEPALSIEDVNRTIYEINSIAGKNS